MMRIAVLRFVHETVTFLESDTTLDDFVYEGSPARGDSLLNFEPTSYIGGFVKTARESSDVELVGIESPLDSKRDVGSGWIREETYERLVTHMIREVAEFGPFDGVYLSLHGAMAVRGVPRPEADIARRVREAVGSRSFIAATFDPHGNEDEEFLRHADLAFAAKYYPHYDGYLQGERAARALVRAIRGDYRPTSVTVKVPIITPTVRQWTGASPWMDLVQRALTWEAREPDSYINLFYGFPWADVPDVGMTIQVLTNGKPELARYIAEHVSQAAWRAREAMVTSATVHAIPDGIALARRAVADGKTPVVVADHSDRSGGATWVLKEVIDDQLANTLIATIADPQTLAGAWDQGVKLGDAIEITVGGLLDESAGQPMRIEGTVLHVGDAVGGDGQPPSLSVAFGSGNVVVITPHLVQVIEPWQLHEFGVEANKFDIIVLKSRVHFRRGFDDTGFAQSIILVEPSEPFLGTVHLEALPYHNVRLSDFYPYGEPAFP
jgi:microcystin degradation protein MlrC